MESIWISNHFRNISKVRFFGQSASSVTHPPSVALIGAAKPEQSPGVLEARMFLVLDVQGNPRAQMDANGLRYADENGKDRAQMNANGFFYADETGRQRAQFGVVEVVTPETGEESRYPGGLALFDTNGKVIWEAPN